MNLKFTSLLILFVLQASVYAAVEGTITENKNKLQIIQKEQKRISQKLEDIADEILREKRKSKNIDKDIKQYNQELLAQKDESEQKKKALKALEDSVESLKTKEKEFKDKIVNILMQEFSILMLSQNNDMMKEGEEDFVIYESSIESLVTNEVLQSLNSVLQNNFKKINEDFMKVNSEIAQYKKAIEKLKFQINALEAKKEKLTKLKMQKKEIIRNLNHTKTNYAKKLNQMQKEQIELSQTLEKLNIIEEKKKQSIIKENKNTDLNVRRIGSSYQESNVKKYTGAKTIPPLEKYTVSQQFGNFRDPVYNIKVFNESIVLKSQTSNAKVRNILEGKVIFAKKTPVLDNVVIVKNSNNIHTIYAHLSQIAPTIKTGKKVNKYDIIGRVDSELTFEVTQNKYHINPLELIR